MSSVSRQASCDSTAFGRRPQIREYALSGACRVQTVPLGVGEQFAGSTVMGLLGSGGMGEVYLVKHPRLPRQDALKVLPAAISNDKDFRTRFEREADLAATLYHAHIVGVHDRGEENGQLWISMDFVDGTDAARLISEAHTGMAFDDVLQSSTQSPTPLILPTNAGCCTAMSSQPTSC
jgi:Protein kinase domain